MRKLIVIMGKARSGKDTFIDYLIPALADKAKIETGAFADSLKVETMNRLSIPDLETLNYCKDNNVEWNSTNIRKYLQTLGDELKATDPNYFAKKLDEKIVQSNADYFIVKDLRFLNELSYLLSKYKDNIYLIKISRCDRVDIGNHHASEYEMDYIESDLDIENDSSLADLEKQANDVAKMVLDYL